MSTLKSNGEVSLWLERNPDKIAAVAKATGIDPDKLASLARGKGQLSADELQHVSQWLKDYKPTN